MVSGLDHPPFISHKFRPFRKGTTLLRGLTNRVINHLLNGMILQVYRLVN